MPNDSIEYLAAQVTEALYGRVIQNTDPDTASAVAVLLGHARALHRALDHDHLHPGTQLIMQVNAAPSPSTTVPGIPIVSLKNLVEVLPPDRAGLTIHVLFGGTYSYEFGGVVDDVDDGYIKYVIQPFVRESVLAAGEAFDIASLSGLASPFALPYFRDLDSALEDYYVQTARKSYCADLTQAWGDSNRIVFSNKPEKHMRRSLYNYLRIRLRDAAPTVLQEQNVNETEPVDIRIQWLEGNRTTLLEVKWIGDSLGPNGRSNSTKYRDQRARDGYKQLRDYVVEQRLTIPGHIVRGRLVVFDARRKGITVDNTGTASCADGWSFESKEIDYASVFDPDPGLDQPVRFFLEPLVGRAA